MRFLLVLLSLVGFQAVAHHSIIEADTNTILTEEARVVSWEYMNPHSILTVELDSGRVIELITPSLEVIGARGVTAQTYPVNARVRVRYNPYWDLSADPDPARATEYTDQGLLLQNLPPDMLADDLLVQAEIKAVALEQAERARVRAEAIAAQEAEDAARAAEIGDASIRPDI
jgi:hypothetical protein